MTIYKLLNPVKNYDWGSIDSVTHFFGIENPEKKPIAEIWMGAHTQAPSKIIVDGKPVGLDRFLAENPENLGKNSIEKFGNTLPFLFKILSADRPLSIQVHPDKQQAKQGFADEQQLAIPLDAFHRNYRDDNHKPELVYALTPFQAMNGFREIEQIIELFDMAQLPILESSLGQLQSQEPDSGLKPFYEFLMTLPEQQRQQLIENAIQYADQSDNAIWQEVKYLHESYPGDIGVLSPLLLNVIHLEPGQAMFLKAGTLHAYMKGTALEIMACSDNVLRGGLTSKYVDISELLKTLTFSTTKHSELLLQPVEMQNGSRTFIVPVADFSFSIMDIRSPLRYDSIESAEILFCINGEIKAGHSDKQPIHLKAGESCFVSALAGSYTITGSGQMAKARTG